MNKEFICFCLGIIFCIGIFILAKAMDQEENEIFKRMKYFNENEYENQSMTGINIPNFGYFVDTRERSDYKVKLTDAHEEVHESIRQNWTCGSEGCYEHFCGE